MRNKKYTGYWLVLVVFWLLMIHIQYPIFNSQATAAATKSNNNFKRKFLQIALNIPEDEKDKQAKDELKSIIEQIRSIELELQKQTFEPAIVLVEVPKKEPNEVVVEDKTPEEQPIKVIEPSLSDGIIASRTVQKIKKFSQDPNDIKNPFELAETLYLSGYLKEAVVFYQEALRRKNPDDTGATRDRAWILFQIGNCLRKEDRAAAIKFYEQLIIEYPNSTWKEFAATRRSLLDWYLKDEPLKLINERNIVLGANTLPKN